MCPMKDYIWSRQANIAEYIANRPIFELCMGAEQIPGSSRFKKWWDKDINWEEKGDIASEGSERELG